MKNTVSLLEHYILENKLDKPWKNEYPLFINNQHNKLTKEGVAYIISKYVGSSKKNINDCAGEGETPYVSSLKGNAFTAGWSQPHIYP